MQSPDPKYGSTEDSSNSINPKLSLNSAYLTYHKQCQETETASPTDTAPSCSFQETAIKKESTTLRRLAISASLHINLVITVLKMIAYIQTYSLAVLAALVDSVLDVVSQFVLDYTERHSTRINRSSVLYPAGAARLEPVGVLTCAALMGMASFEILKESLEEIFIERDNPSLSEQQSMASFWSMVLIVFVKLGLLFLCRKAMGPNSIDSKDSTLKALAQDHLNDGLSNAIAAGALLAALTSPELWWIDPIGAILISIYIIHSWYSTGKEQIEQLTGRVAPDEFIEELRNLAENYDSRMSVDVCRAYHFGPKFLVELEVVLPKDTLLFESHDLGMELQYEIEGREEVERCFVHIDYETRPYDEHVVSKVPELRDRFIRHKQESYKSLHSV